MSKTTLFIPLLFLLLVGCSESKPEVTYFSIHALCESPDATPEQVQYFLDLGVDVNEKKGDLGRTPLMCASRNNPNAEVIRLLLKSGSDVSMKDDTYGATSLHLAAQNNEKPEVISVLLKAGAEVNAKLNAKDGEYGAIALDFARQNGALQGTDALKELEAATNR